MYSYEYMQVCVCLLCPSLVSDDESSKTNRLELLGGVRGRRPRRKQLQQRRPRRQPLQEKRLKGKQRRRPRRKQLQQRRPRRQPLQGKRLKRKQRRRPRLVKEVSAYCYSFVQDFCKKMWKNTKPDKFATFHYIFVPQSE